MKLFHPTSIWLKFNNRKRLNDPNPYWLQHPEVEPLEPQQKWVPSGHQTTNHVLETLRLTRSTKTPSKKLFVLTRLFFFFFFLGGGTGNMKITNWVYTCLRMTTHPTWTKSSSLMEKSEICLFLDSRSVTQQKSPNISDMNMVNVMKYKVCQKNSSKCSYGARRNGLINGELGL